ncbi:hypothetical protein BH11ACT1_BH11ACT1_16980 [soil metagenome]
MAASMPVQPEQLRNAFSAPVVVGCHDDSVRLFADGARVDLTLERSLTTTTGVIIAQYAVAR